jgi:hypothetical protein
MDIDPPTQSGGSKDDEKVAFVKTQYTTVQLVASLAIIITPLILLVYPLVFE